MSNDHLLCDDELYDGALNGDDDSFGGLDVSMNGEPKSAEELGAIRARVIEMEEEAAKLKQLQNQVDDQIGGNNIISTTTPVSPINSVPNSTPTTPGSTITSPQSTTAEAKVEMDSRSIYVGNVDYGATAEELEAHFHGCGNISRVTILCNKFDGHPKGFAYIEFTDKDSVQTAMAMDESLFRGRQIKVNPKRTNKPGLSTTNRGAPTMRGRGFPRSRPFRGGYMYSGYRPVRRARGYRRAAYFPY